MSTGYNDAFQDTASPVPGPEHERTRPMLTTFGHIFSLARLGSALSMAALASVLLPGAAAASRPPSPPTRTAFTDTSITRHSQTLTRRITVPGSGSTRPYGR